MSKFELLGMLESFLSYASFVDLINDVGFKAFCLRPSKGSGTDNRFEQYKVLSCMLMRFLPHLESAIIENVTIENPELLPPNRVSKSSRKKIFVLDLKVTFRRKSPRGNTEKEPCNVEMQAMKQKWLLERMLCYASRIYSSQLKTGENYEHQVRTYSLVFSAENIDELSEDPDFYTAFSFKSDKNPPVVLDKGIFLILVELAKFNETNIEKLDARGLWCYILKQSSKLTYQECVKLIEKGGEEMEEALSRLLDISQDKKIQNYVESREKQLRGQRANEMGAREEGIEKGREEGIEVGREKGLEEGIAKGIEKGREKGIEEGIEKGIKQVAQRMLLEGKNIAEIAHLTGLSKSTIQNLKNSNRIAP